jgi:uncharacterized protein
VILGAAHAVTDREEKASALRAIVDHVVPGRWDSVRAPNAQELKATTVLRLPLTEASAKIRAGGPLDDEEDHAIDVWAGQLPLTLTPGAPVPDSRLKAGIELPSYLGAYERPG